MGRLKGSLNRKSEDSVLALRGWLSLEKIRRAVEGGCQWCHHIQKGSPTERAPFKLSFLHKDPATREFDISQGPNWKGMTQVRLELEVAKCDLVCRRCFGSILECQKTRPERLTKRRSEMSKKERHAADELVKERANFDELYGGGGTPYPVPPGGTE